MVRAGANPDGYQYTFDHERLWRKNLRDNNGDGQTQVGDGVDPNRNFPNHWGYDEEGSSSIQSSETYRGPAPLSEPETQAMIGLLDRIGFAFQVNYHSAGQWLLYAEGWQTGTPTADDPIYYALSGNLDDPAIADFHPGLSSDVLYVTNGETTDYAHVSTRHAGLDAGAVRGLRRLRLRLPRRRGAGAGRVRAQPALRRLGRATRRRDPDDPKTVTGIKTKPFYLDSDDPYKSGNPGVQLSFTKSYGDPQPVAVLAKRSLGKVTRQVPHQRRPRPLGVHAVSGAADRRTTRRPSTTTRCAVSSRGTDPGDSVKVWFEARRPAQRVVHLRRGLRLRQRRAGGRGRGLHRRLPGAADRRPALRRRRTSTRSPPTARRPTSTTSTPPAGSRPDALGVLSHYDAVVW